MAKTLWSFGRSEFNRVNMIITMIIIPFSHSAFWHYVKEFLTKHEAERFLNLKNINTESGRGRAWLRAALNEHSLERYMHMLIESDVLLG